MAKRINEFEYEMTEEENRRPLKVRGNQWAQNIAKYLSSKNFTPNQISVWSVFFAALASCCLFLLPGTHGTSRVLLLVGVAIAIQLRLLCNLFDGMVAVEGGKGTAAGELFNDMPDRIADALILVAMGYSISFTGYCHELGWAAALLAVMTAYVRTLANSIGAPTNFCGPMAKQHRMALVTGLSLLSLFESSIAQPGQIFFIGLIVIIVGSTVTIIRRAVSAYKHLEGLK